MLAQERRRKILPLTEQNGHVVVKDLARRSSTADYFIHLSLDIPEAAMIKPGRLVAFSTGVRKGLNPDEPQNLTRVVVLEGNKDGGLPGGAT